MGDNEVFMSKFLVPLVCRILCFIDMLREYPEEGPQKTEMGRVQMSKKHEQVSKIEVQPSNKDEQSWKSAAQSCKKQEETSHSKLQSSLLGQSEASELKKGRSASADVVIHSLEANPIGNLQLRSSSVNFKDPSLI